jgi:hypothetical protein
MDLQGFEMFANSGLPIQGATVNLYAATSTQPNAGSILQTTTTNSQGLWAFTGLSDAAYDVEVVTPGTAYHKWYKGNSKVGVLDIRTGDIHGPAGFIDTVDIAAHATSVVGATQDFSGGTIGITQSVISSLSLTIPTGTVGDIVMEVSCSPRNGAINVITQMWFQLGAGSLLIACDAQQGPADASYKHNMSGKRAFLANAAGTYSCKLYAQAGSGTTTFDVCLFNAEAKLR